MLVVLSLCSGVAVLSSCTDCSGSSGSDITEPGSPCSPSSSSSGCVSEGGGGGGGGALVQRPAWPWAAKRPRQDKCTNLEALIATKLSKPAPPVSPASPADCLDPAQIPKHVIHKAVMPGLGLDPASQQGRITEYFKSQMKPNALKRDIAAWITKATDGKSRLPTNGVTKGSCETNDNLEKYISFLSQTLSPKVLLTANVRTDAEQNTNEIPESYIHISPQKQQDRKPLPGLNPILNSKSNYRPLIAEKTDVNKTSTVFEKKLPKEFKSIGTSTTPKQKRTRKMDGKKSLAPKITKTKNAQVRNTTQKSVGVQSVVNAAPFKATSNNCVLPKLGTEGNKPAVNNSSPLYSNSTPPLPSNANHIIHDHMRHVFMKLPLAEMKSLQTDLSKSIQVSSECKEVDRVPCYNNQAQIQNCNLSVTTNNSNIVETHRTESIVNSYNSNTCVSNLSMSQPTVMLTAIRIPQQSLHQLGPSDSQGNRNPNHISLTSPTKLNGQFMLPMVQNINGSLMQIPSLVTKMGQNTVLPLSAQNIMQRTDSIVNQQTTQMFINGTILKINGPMHPSLPSLIAKQMTATSTTNVSYTVTQKNISTSMPTVMVSKPNFTMNLNHPMFVSSSGFILNPVGSVVTTQTNTGISHVQQTYSSNNVHQPFNGNVQHSFNGNAQQTFNGNAQQAFGGNVQQTFNGNTQPAFNGNVQQTFNGNAQTTYNGNSQPAYNGNVQQAFNGNAQQTFNGNGQQTFNGNAQQTFNGNAQQTFNGNMVLTAPVHSNVHINPNISNHISGLSMPTCSIPISPLKIGDINRVFLTPTRPPIPKMSLISEPVANTVLSNSKTNIITSTVENGRMQNVDITISNSTTKYSVPKPEAIVDTIVSQALEVTRKLPNPINGSKSVPLFSIPNITVINETVEELITVEAPSSRLSRDDSTDSIENELDDSSKLDQGSPTFNESKSSPDTTISELTSTESSVTEAGKEIDDDSFLTIDTSVAEDVLGCQKSPILSPPKTIRFPVKKPTDSRNRGSTRSNASENKLCRWNDCTLCFDDSGDLLEHLQVRKNQN